MLEELYYDLYIELAYWAYTEERPYYDDDVQDIESHRYQKKGYTGITVNNYSEEEYNKIYNFCLSNQSVITKHGIFVDTNEVLGECKFNYINVYTLQPEKLFELLNNLPARSKISKTQPMTSNVVKFDGENCTLYMYEPNNNTDTMKKFDQILTVMRKINR